MLKHRGFPGRMPGTDFQFTIRRENRKDYVDMIAATLILQGYLDRRNNEKKKETE